MKSAFLALVASSLFAAAPAFGAPAVPQVVQHIPLHDGGWDILTVDPDNHHVLVARSDGVDAVDTRTGAVTARFVTGTRFHGVSVVPGTELAVATEAAGSALVFNRVTGKVTAEVKTDPDADATLYEPATRTVWVMNGDSGTISVVDPVAGRAVAKINIGSALEFADTDGRGHVFVNLSDKGQLAEVDAAKRSVVGTVPLSGCQHPTGLAYVSPGLIISACANGIAKVTRASDLKPIADIAIGPRPDGAFADEARHRAYIPSGGDGTLAVIDTSGPLPRKIATVQTQQGARTGAVDPSSGTVYSPTAKFGPPPAGGGRPSIVPGSVELLVIR
jgi:DNA-binding beta-propeller fold protein YncE